MFANTQMFKHLHPSNYELRMLNEERKKNSNCGDFYALCEKLRGFEFQSVVLQYKLQKCEEKPGITQTYRVFQCVT